MSWVRLWSDMPTDPKWRVVARKSGRPLSEVISVFAFMLLNAGANASERNERETERGELKNWSDEDVAAALDTDPEHIAAIRQAMQGKTLEGNKLTGWEKRQPKREDGSAERAKQWRERKRTQENAEKRPDTDSDTDRESISAVARTAEPSACKPRATRLGSDWKLPDDWRQWARINFVSATDAMVSAEADQFRDFWISKAGREAAKLDWEATWRNWCRNSRTLGITPKGLPINNGRMAWDEKKAKTAYLPTPRNRELSPEERERIAMEMERMN